MMIVWPTLVGVFAAAFGAWSVARSVLRQPRGTPRVLATALLAWVWITVGTQLLGTLGLLQPAGLVGWSLLGAGVGLAAMMRRQTESDDLPPPVEPTGWEGWVAVGLLVWAALTLGLPSLLYPVKVVSDGPIYHLYFAARWWKAGKLILVASPFGESAATYFPANGDLWFSWLMTTWGGDRIAKLGQAPFLAMACLAAFASARELGASRTSALVASSLFGTCAPLILFSFEPNVDTIFVAGYLTAAFFFLRYALGRDGLAALLLGGLAAGEALGTKSVGNLFVPPLIAVACWAIVRRERAARPVLVGGATILAGLAATSAFWFARNALLTGNPLYPLTVKLGGATLLAGWYGPDAMRSSIYHLPVGEWRALGDILVAVFDARTVPLWLAAILGCWAVGRSRRPGDGWVWAFALGAVVNIALYWLFIPYRTQQRFMLQGIGLAVVPLALLLDRARWLRLLAVAIMAVHVMTPQSWPFGPGDANVPWDLDPRIPNAMGSLVPLVERMGRSMQGGGVSGVIDLLAPALAAGLAVYAWSRWQRGLRGTVAWTAALVALGIMVGVGWLRISPFAGDSRLLFFPNFPDFYRGWTELDVRSGPAGSRVAYAGTNIPYYLMGTNLRNEVRYVNVEGPADWLIHDFHRRALAEGRGEWTNARPGWDRERPDFNAWLKNLRAEGVQLLVVTKVNPGEGSHNVADAQGFPVERGWADSHPDVFEPLYGPREGDPWFRLYRVRPGAGRG
ncbi:phospholipid carrier-dependent glycosyltransferase [Paludisphaera rhizosphaerae]|uniref:phospholipid carrier-dependent glycosyltransferase n=2 Tax=Paludisphaera rhizosphaerae TaxID=2711216 RepID=UPI0013EBFA16|nr:phospholipid carrier-dependent glycosyltransferase [Paludisphaera rhizosphaerae]